MGTKFNNTDRYGCTNKQAVATLVIMLFLISFIMPRINAQTSSIHIGDVITNPDGSKGVVFWLNPDRSGGWMCALNDVNSSFSWSTQSVTVPGFPALTTPSTDTWQAYTTVISDTAGYSHTQLLRAAGDASTYPAAYAVDFAQGWYLPAIGQLLILYGQQATISAVLSANGGSEISRSSNYWSSTYSDNSNGYYLYNPYGNWSTTSKSTAYSVRPVRSFNIQNTSTADSNFTYLWNTGDTIATITVSPNTTTTYQVIATNGAGCSDTAQFTLYVNNIDTIHIADFVCQGEPYTVHGFNIPTDSTMIPHTIVETRRATSLQTGCDSCTVLTLSVLPNSYTSVMTESCDSYTWNDSIYTTSGDYVQHFPAANGCDSVVTLHLTINSSNTGVDEQTACDSYTWIDGVTYTQSTTTPTYTLTNAAGCDSVVTLHLTINNPVHEAMTIIAYDSFVWNGTTYTQSGDYTFSHEDGNGCTQVDTLHLTIYYSSHNEFSATACEEYTWNDSTYYTSGNYVQQFSDIHGADSVMTLHLTVNYGTHNIESDTACETYTWHVTTYTTSGTYTYNYNNASGCASVDTLHLTVNYADTVRINDTICQGEQYNGHGFIIPADSTMIPHTIVETRHATSLQTGCDSCTVLTLSVLPNSYTSVMTESCDSYTWNDSIYTTSGDYVQHFPAANGCDSVVTLHLTINSSNTGVDEQTACDSYTWIDGVTYTQSTTTPTYTLTNAAGCDSVVTLHLTINSSNTGVDEQTACDSYTWIDDVTYTQSTTTPTYTLTNAAGCDSVVTLHLTINSSNTGVDEQTACDSYTWIDDVTYTQSTTTPTYTLTNAAGCDSVVTLHLTINSSNTGVDEQTACDSYTWIDGVTYTQSTTTPTYTLTNAAGCDSVVTLHLTINNPVHEAMTIIAYDSFVWNGTTYTQSGDYTFSHEDGNGCSQVDTLHLTLYYSSHNEFSATTCEEYSWNDSTYYASGTYTQQFTDIHGADSVMTLHLTVNYGTHNIESDTACETYTWHGTTYTTSGTYTYNYNNASGCASVDTLHLTVNYADTVRINDTICQGEQYNGHGFIIPADSTMIPHTIVETRHATSLQTGCDSTTVLTLSVLPNSYTSVMTESCGRYTWNDSIYTTSGDYVQHFPSANGCDSVVTLHLTINYPAHQATTVVACETYTWTDGNGQTYTAGGNYTYTHNDANGCTQVDTLHLTINYPAHQATTVVACETYTWTDGNGQTYTAGGNYTYTHNDANGCTQVDTLHLTINNPTHQATSITAYDSYLWNGTTYTQSGDYIFSYEDENGCTQVDTLHLTLYYSSHNEFSATACEEYSWNDSTYYVSGTYIQQFTDIHGADSVMTLHLTVNYGTHNVQTETACETYTWHETTYTTSGTYIYEYSNATGCPSVDTLHLTVNYADTVRINDTICQGEPYTAYGFNIPADSTMIPHIIVETVCTPSLQTGCDSITILTLTVNNSTTTEFSASNCLNYTWNDSTYYSSGDKIQHFPAANGCDSIVTLHLTIIDTIRTDIVDSACFFYTWNGNTYEESGDYALYYVTARGCDSMVTLHLTINHPQNQHYTVTSCDHYTWEDGTGDTYYESGVYQHNHLNAHGCWQVDWLHLNIIPVDTVFINDSINQNNPYTAYGFNIPADSTAYPHVIVETVCTPSLQTGCDSCTVLTLTVLPAYYTSVITESCGSYTWNGIIYTASGDYTQQFHAVNGYDSTVTLHLTVNYGTLNVETENACGTYTWHETTYTTSGTYIYEYSNATGCPSVDTLHLTVNYADTVRINDTICQGEPYTAYGFNIPADSTMIPHVIVETVHAPSLQTGCDSCTILTLTVLPPVTSQFNATSCGSYIWNGTTYTSSGNYQQTFTNHNGCDSTVTLHLTIYSPAHHSEGLTACGSYIWTTGNGQTYTASGTYTHSHTDSHGCTQVDTLHLTIINPTHQSYNVEACETFTWTDGNSETYTESGTYTYTHQDAQYCIQTDTLHLTIQHGVTVNIEDQICKGEPYNGHGFNIPADSTMIPHTIVETVCTPSLQTGCDSCTILTLTVLPSYDITLEDRVCQGEPYNGHGFNIPADSTMIPHIIVETQNFASLQTGCDSTVTLNLHVIEESVIIIGPSVDFCETNTALLEAESPMNNFVWSTGETTQSIVATGPGTYTVVAIEGNCSASTQYVITPCEFTLYLPNSITASESDGLNDIFQIVESQQAQIKDDDFSVVIYDRWGIKVFHSYDKAFQWDGKINGRVLEGNMYVYHITYRDLINRFKTLRGTVITF